MELKAKMKEFGVKVKDFFKKHKKLIVLGTVTVGGIVACVVLDKRGKAAQRALKALKADDLAKNVIEVDELTKKLHEASVMEIQQFNPNWSVGSIEGVEHYCDNWNSIEVLVNDLKLDDIGKLGEELLKSEGVTDDKNVSVFVYLFDPVGKNEPRW